MAFNFKESKLKFYEKKVEISKKFDAIVSKSLNFIKNRLKFSLAYLYLKALTSSAKSVFSDISSELVWIYVNGFLINFALGMILKARFSVITINGHLMFLAYGILLYMIENLIKKIYQNKKEVARVLKG